MNITLIIAGFVTLLLCILCFREGMTKVLGSLIAWIVAILVITLLVIIYLGFKNENIKLTVVMIIALVLVGFIYGIIHFVVRSIRMIAKLPVFRLLDQLLGLAVGVAEGIILIWLLFVINEAGLLGEFGEIISRDTASSQILSTLYEYNYLVKLILMVKVV
ncbi:MAG: CvpA family protein [Lachnospiraceae bacterium]|nr:CvpA family protein [Lachnospiraceae bacterium]